MLDLLFVLPLLLCMSAMVSLMCFTLRAAAFVRTDPGCAGRGCFRPGQESAIVPLRTEGMMAGEQGD